MREWIYSVIGRDNIQVYRKETKASKQVTSLIALFPEFYALLTE